MFKNINLKKVAIFIITLFILLFIYLIKIYVSYEPKKLVENINYSKIDFLICMPLLSQLTC